MRNTAMAISLVISLAASSEAHAKNCVIRFYHLYLTPQIVELQESASGATLTLFNTGIKEDIVFKLDRQIVTRLDNKDKFSILYGKETIKSDSLVNELAFSIHDKTLPSGNRLFSISTTTFLDRVVPEEQTLGGVLSCKE